MRHAFGVGVPQKNKIFICWSRGAGKDIVSWNILIRKALTKTAQYFYLLPTQKQARLVLWDSVIDGGFDFKSFIPPALIKKINNTRLSIELVNGSIINILGSNKAKDSLVGSNPSGVVFSETQVSNMPEAYDYIRPRLALNNGFVLLNGTARGANYFYTLYQISKENPEDWFCSYKTCYDTQHIDSARLAKERATMSEDMFKQEYECNFQVGIKGCYYGREIDKMKLEERVTHVVYEPSHPVFVAVDLGVSDPSVFIFFQVIGNLINIIDYEEHTDRGLDWYAKMMDEKEYKYSYTFFPHDLRVREIGARGAITREEVARQLGFNVDIVPNVSVEEGIEAVRMILPRCWIDEKKCSRLVRGLELYHREFDEERQTYREKPVHDQWSHIADAMRMLALSLPRCNAGTSQEELDRMFMEAKYGVRSNIPPVFQDRHGY